MGLVLAGALSVGAAGLFFTQTAFADEVEGNDQITASAEFDNGENLSTGISDPTVTVVDDTVDGTVDETDEAVSGDVEDGVTVFDDADDTATDGTDVAETSGSEEDGAEPELTETAYEPVGASLSNDARSVVLTVTDVDPAATKVLFPVWSVVNGQDDLVWHNATKQADGSWSATVQLSKHKGTGEYAAHCYQVIDGAYVFIGTTSFDVAAPTAEVVVADTNTHTGTYTVTVYDIESPSGITKVQMPTWVKANQLDIKWYAGVANGDGSYTFTVPMCSHGWTAGTYNTHVYITDGNGNQTRVGAVTQTMRKPATSISAELNESETAVLVTAVIPNDVTQVLFPTWSAVNGQDDIVWHKATKQFDGTWVASIALKNHKGIGDYAVHCYATSGGKQSCVGSISFETAAPTAEAVVSDEGSYTAGTYTVTVSGIESPSGITKVQMPTWVKSNQSDIKWYTAVSKGNGVYQVTVPLSDHAWESGIYHTHVYVTDGNGNMTRVGVVDKDMKSDLSVVVDDKEEKATVSVTLPYSAQGVKFPTWSTKGGQDDIVWYQGTYAGNGVWTVTVPLLDHKSTGAFSAHCYATVGGKSYFAGNTSFALTRPVANVQVSVVNASAGTYTVTLTGVDSASGISKVLLPTWVKSDQADIKWYAATANNDGTYTLTVSIANHGNTYGTYHTHVYITNAAGKQFFVGSVDQAMNKPTASSGSNTGDFSSVTAGATGQKLPNGMYSRADAVARMLELVTNPIHGYDQAHRDGPDYDCSSAVCEAYGISHGNTSSIPSLFSRYGAAVYTWDGNAADLEPGDLIGTPGRHVIMYIGNGKVAEFCINENGGITGGQTGDQTGNESRITNFYNPSYGWSYVISPRQ